MEAWGKYGNNADSTPYPLIAHLLDTAAVSTVLWDSWISNPVRDLIAPLFGSDPRAGIALLAGSHDLGKLDPLFQGQLLMPSSRREKFARFIADLGLPVPNEDLVNEFSKYSQSLRGHLRHEALSAHILERRETPRWACAVIAGHHGRYQSDLSFMQTARIRQHRKTLDDNDWNRLHNHHLSILYEALGVNSGGLRESLPLGYGAVIPILTGLVVLADWFASDEAFVSSAPLEKLQANPRSYLNARTVQAETSLDRYLGRPVHKCGEFKDLFTFEADRPVQEWANEVSHGPGLTIVAVPTGEGKTETALWIHSVRPDLNDGLMFALPTTATADAMFDRIRTFFEDTKALAHLTHGRAILNAFYAESAASPTGICDEDSAYADVDLKTGLRPSSWFSGPHRGLTAPVTVGTCDQVLAASLSHKYLPLRLASLANKHVILDEIHTYDPHQQRLLVRLLGWLGFCRSRVTLLSATLPRQRLIECVDAYLEGWNRFDENAISINNQLADYVYPAVVRTTPEGTLDSVNLTSYRTYVHEIIVQPIKGIDDAFDRATAKLAHDRWDPGKNQRVALIVNTVNRAQRVAHLLREMGHDVLLLHSRMTANQRAEATSKLMGRCGKKAGQGSIMFVSTQIAESSLDIDVDLLITDIAPMSSLIQRFGRQWRHSQNSADGNWVHPSHLQYRSGNPLAIILVSMNDEGRLHDHGHYPYTRAEINKTLNETAALDGGNRTELRIPGDVQAAVDAANVSWNDLVSANDESVGELTNHLARVVSAAQTAKFAGVDASSLAVDWREASHWEDNSTLHQMTVGTLWNDEAVTRMREGETVQVLIYDPSGQNPYALPYFADSIKAVSGKAQIKEILGYVIPVSGVLVRDLRTAAQPLIPSGWENHPSPLIQSLLPIPVASLAGIAELTADGLVKTEMRNK
ncbi:CRISPR-associated helicase Cas3' [Acidithrix sp. C25]|uniref:CRISPR-associated helicase Cas3' n=1 Tax=Acidithrix sp. C25 TaxID=1671482 RepID=UPI00191BA5C9|nr:CRISPR-associated helicase Cas3' [Acidithrix sp. C25]CAG4902504.1 unnamed protein product [Acidithrix sp. C25]